MEKSFIKRFKAEFTLNLGVFFVVFFKKENCKLSQLLRHEPAHSSFSKGSTFRGETYRNVLLCL